MKKRMSKFLKVRAILVEARSELVDSMTHREEESRKLSRLLHYVCTNQRVTVAQIRSAKSIKREVMAYLQCLLAMFWSSSYQYVPESDQSWLPEAHESGSQRTAIRTLLIGGRPTKAVHEFDFEPIPRDSTHDRIPFPEIPCTFPYISG